MSLKLRTALITLLTALLLAPAATVAEGKKARAAQECANVDLEATKDNLGEIRAAILCLHNKVRAEHVDALARERQVDLLLRGRARMRHHPHRVGRERGDELDEHEELLRRLGPARVARAGRLRRAALGHSRAMVSNGFFEHTTPAGVSMTDRILRSGYVSRDQAWSLGENLAWGTGEYATPRGAIDAWLDSPGHRANLLKRSYRELGVGVVLGNPSTGSEGATYTVDFGVRR